MAYDESGALSSTAPIYAFLEPRRLDGRPTMEWKEKDHLGEAGSIMLCNRSFSNHSSRFELEQEVHTLQQVLQEEMELHVILENALEHAAVTLSDLSYLPNEAQDLLSNTPSLEMTISRLEEEMTSLHFQLIQERNERRLTEYQLKQLPAQPSKFAPAKNAANDTSSMFDQEEKLPEKEFCQVVPTEIFRKQIPIKDLWNHPNQLAKEIVRCRSLIEQLAEENPVHLTGNEKLALWINLYNALIMHAYLAYGVPKSDMKLFLLLYFAAYTVGGHSFSAASIEYGTLKMKPPVHRHQTALLLALHKLKLSEEQKKFSIETFEPLVAFALNWILSFEA
ncbi:uncharacterized protein LOC122002193 [Zingiber officinale]|uniref:uncharacterized protein LOC122002193 n=1 Tax=Zingiber officinale TaxID=94328 RepID=UPI001C4D0FF7|nr:uncharacterized protein LOC122002193 [Zingiber officinale]